MLLLLLLLLASGGSITFVGQSNRNAVLRAPRRCPIPWRSPPQPTFDTWALRIRGTEYLGPQPSLSSHCQQDIMAWGKSKPQPPPSAFRQVLPTTHQGPTSLVTLPKS